MPPGNNYIYNLQVLSESVGKAVMLVEGPEAQETAKFVLLFDKFFDACPKCGRLLQRSGPYYSETDFRLNHDRH